MNFNCSVGLLVCIVMLGMVLFLYRYDPDTFISRIYLRTAKIKYFFIYRFGKNGKTNKEKLHKLNTTTKFCEEAVSKYVNKKNLSTLQNDETLQNLLVVYRELLDLNNKTVSEYSLEQIQDIWHKVEELYFPDMDPYYDTEEYFYD